ncbi:hypothetical protein LTR40_005285 [Exophiala xenobiotica]|nr:hypothetical protein LTR40_005285 [Exophiala xenobiotica]
MSLSSLFKQHYRRMGYISKRALDNLVPNKLQELRSHCFHNQYDKVNNPNGIVALAIAENKLMRDEICQHINKQMNINPWHLTYGQGPNGDPALRRALASFVQEVFKPSTKITENHICICNGAGSAVDNLSFCMGEPGDGILVGRPLKDFCANGTRIGALISPFNPQLMRSFRSVASFTRASQLAEHAWLNLLTDKAWLDWYFPLFQSRMTDAYEYAASFLRDNKISYNPASVTSFVWLDLSRWLKEDSQDAELELNWRMAKGGVWLAMGASFGSEKNGNFRLTFATPREELKLGLER